MVGKAFGHYRVAEKIGAGGMGEVYRARDERLGREVALKLLPDAFARDPERLIRFEREARLLASLNDPNIAAIYGLEESNGQHFLVLELVPGPTLAERLTAGPLPVQEALGVCRQIAEALEAAHEKGIIHRDLKPGNIKVTPEGKVKVLDFGLAKAFAGETAATDISKSPTVSEVVSQQGVILGTAAYMSPEQARGKPLDKRTDIWAFGCVLYETLTGKQAFSGETVSDTLVAVLKSEPPWQALPPATPPAVARLLRRCLEKDRNGRWHDIADARIELEAALVEPGPISPGLPAVAPALGAPAWWLRVIPWGVAGVMAAVATALAVSVLFRAAPQPRPVSRFPVNLPPGDSIFSQAYGSLVALSPDGTRLVYVGLRAGKSQLFLRPMDQLEATPIAGTENAQTPFFSPDGEWVGFSAEGKLKKVSVWGGPALTLCDAPYLRGASWAPDDIILFTPGITTGLSRVPAAGGTPQVVTTPDALQGEYSHRWPDVLPGGRAVLFSVGTGGSFDDPRIAVLSVKTGQWRTLVEGGFYPRYVPTGHLVYVRADVLLAAPFDLGRLEVTGPPVPVLEGVMTGPSNGSASYAFSRLGSLAYVPGSISGSDRTLVWVDRKGVAKPMPALPQPYEWPRLSPNGRQVAVVIRGTNPDIWVYDLVRGTLTRLTFAPGEEETPAWTPDGQRITYAAQRGPKRNLYWKPADGSGAEELLLEGEHHRHVSSWSPDGQVLAFIDSASETQYDIWVLPRPAQAVSPPQPGGASNPRPFLQSEFSEREAMFSPDGGWLAYPSNESGRSEVYVQPFPGPGGKWQISTEGGCCPLWARNGRELFYRSGDKLLAVPVETRPTFKAGTPRLLFEVSNLSGFWHYDVAPDAQHFLMIKEGEEKSMPTQVNVVLEWFDDLKRRIPSARK